MTQTINLPLTKFCSCGHLKDHHLRVQNDNENYYSLQCECKVYDDTACKFMQCGCKK